MKMKTQFVIEDGNQTKVGTIKIVGHLRRGSDPYVVIEITGERDLFLKDSERAQFARNLLKAMNL